MGGPRGTPAVGLPMGRPRKPHPRDFRRLAMSLAAITPALPDHFAAWFAGRGWQPHAHQLAMVEAAAVVKAIQALADSGPGPAGLRPQFLKELVGDDPEDEIVDVFVAFVQLFVDGLAPRYLRQWYGGAGWWE